MDFIIDHDRVKEELRKFSSLPEPQKEVGISDEPVGVLKEQRLKNLYLLAISWRLIAIEELSLLSAGVLRDEDRAFRIAELSERSEILMNVFRASLRTRFCVKDKDVNVRKGWIVVVPK